MKRAFHRALLAAASFLVRAPEREEWLAEWRAELCYVDADRRTGFCLGAFQDAYCLRRDAFPPAAVRLKSPWQCLGVLAVLAALSVFFAFRLPAVRRMFNPPAYTGKLATLYNVPLEDYRQLAAGSQGVAFYRRVRERGLVVSIASRNLFDLLEMPLAGAHDSRAPLLVVTRRASRELPGSGGLTLAGIAVEARSIVPNEVTWRIPGPADAWLLVDDAQLGSVPDPVRGVVLARVEPSIRQVSVRNSEGGIDRFDCQPISQPQPLLGFLVAFLVTALVLPAVTNMSLGEYPAGAHVFSRLARMRRWIFLAAKVGLVLPIVILGPIDLFSLLGDGLYAQGVIVAGVLGFRWVLTDQRRRCPICLRILTNPTSIGQPSRIFLDWYGTELICSRGHGLLHVPEIRNSYNTQRWLHLDKSWSSLFS